MTDQKTPPLNVLFTLPGLQAGGAERVLITLMNGLDRDRYAPVFLSMQEDGPLKELIASDIPFHTAGRRLGLRSFFTLLKIARAIKPDIIVSTMAHMNFAVLLLKVFLPRTKCIVREAITPSFFFKAHKSKKTLIKFLYKVLYPKADILLSPTQKVFDEFESLLSMTHKQSIVLKNPVDVEKIRANIIKPEQIEPPEEHRLNFVACGRLMHQKGFDRLITALEAFEPGYHWQLNILGEGPERDTLESLIATHKLQDRVHLKGLVLPPHDYFAKADAFLMPSRFEGLPNAALEALACGTPVIATQESGGIKEIAEDCGPQHVRVVSTMQAFIAEMMRIKPASKTSAATSLLAPCYKLDSVRTRFAEILECV